jgi:hypothetical protein
MKRIEQLTPEQEQLLPKFRNEWLQHGLSTAPTDRATAEDGMRQLYRAAGLDEPKYVLWFTSPALGAMAVGALKSVNWLEGGQLRGQLLDQLGGQLGDQLGDQLLGQLGGQLGDQLGDQLRDQLGGQADLTWFYGQWDASWIAFYEFGRRIGVQYEESTAQALDAYIAIAQSAGWWWPYKDVCIMTDRPTEIIRDPQSRLHNEDGPALKYSDGYSLYAWHGTRVPEWVIETDTSTWTLDQLLKEPNSEIRRAAIERFGWDAFIAQSGIEAIHTAPDPANPGYDIGLYELPEQVYDEPVRLILVTNASPERDGTRRRFGLTVPAEITDATEAAAWTFNLSADEYRNLTRAT